MTPPPSGPHSSQLKTSSATLRNTLRQMWSVSDKLARRLIVGALLFVLASSVVAAFSPLLLKMLVDTLDPEQTTPLGVAPVYIVVAYGLTQWLSRTLAETRAMLYGRADQRIQVRLSEKLFSTVMSLPLRMHLDRKTGALHQTLTNGLAGYRIVQYHLMNSVLPVIVELATMGSILVLLGHSAFLVVIGLSVLSYAIAFSTGAARVRTPARDASTAHIEAGGVFTDSILNFETVKYFNAELQMRERFTTALEKTEVRWATLYARKMENGVLIATIFAVSLGVSLYMAASAVADGSMSVGEFVLVNAYIIQLAMPIEMIGFAFRDIAEGVAFIEKMAKLLSCRTEVRQRADGASFSVEHGEVQFSDVSFSFNVAQPILRKVSFCIPTGNTLAIVGTSGAGKSSIVRLLLRMLEPTEGRIYLDGRPLSDIPVSAVRDAVAVVPQDIALFNDTISYNIALGKQRSTHEDVVAAAKAADIHDFVLALPNGYDTIVGERGVNLSGGERQRVAIARAAIRSPRLFVFDEATSSLDSETERTVLQNFARVAAARTTIIIAHRLSTVMHANEIIVLESGRVIERGTHGELIDRHGAYAEMWLTQREGVHQLRDTTLAAP